MTLTIGYIVGSISSTSINRQLGGALEKLAPAGVTLVEIPIKDLPMYSADYDAAFPQVALDFKKAIQDVDGLIILTPEYLRSVPGVLKNALDWSARPYGQGVIGGKPVAIAGASVGAVGTAAAQQHLRAILGHLDAITLGQPEVFLQLTPGLVAEDGTVTDEGTAGFLGSFLVAVEGFVTRLKAASAA